MQPTDTSSFNDTLTSITPELDTSPAYTSPVQYVATSAAILYRVRKAGKYLIIKTPKENDARSLAMLKREYELSIGKQHPHIVNVFTYEPSTVVGPGIIMEYIEGRNLRDFLAENPSSALRCRVFQQLLSAVSYIHRCGLVHNDIKPENIMITRADNDVKLIDFGVADSDTHYLSRTLGCTPLYASPELLARDGNIDARSDIYSLGVIMRDIFQKRYSRISSRCLYADREKRYANAEALQTAFSRRNYLLYAMFATMLVVLSLLPLLMYIQVRGELVATRAELQQQVEAVDNVQAASLREKAYIDSVKAIIDTRTADAYNKLCDSLATSPLKDQYGFVKLHTSFLQKSSSMDIWNMGNIPSKYLPELTIYEQFLKNEYIGKLKKAVDYENLPSYLGNDKK